MKKNNLLIIEITLILIAFLLSACSGLTGGTKSENLCTVTGTIQADGTINLNNSRTATVTFEASETDVWSVSATDGSKTREGSVENGTYSIALPKGSWTIEAFLKNADDAILLYGSTELTVDSSYENVSDKNIFVAPKNDEDLTGSVKLSFKDESGKLSCVNCKIQDLEVEAASFNAQGLATLLIPGLSAASYEAKLYFDDAAGNTLYSCNEAFNVFNNWQTSTWKLADSSESATFVVTQDMIDLYGTQVVPTTTNALYGNFHTSEQEAYLYDFYFTDDLAAELPQGTSTQRTQGGNVNYCFDSNGDIYYFDYNDGTHTLRSTKSGFTVTASAETYFTDFMNIDRKSDTFYLAHISENNKKQITLYKYPKLLSEQSDSEKTSCIITGFTSDLPTFCPFAIYDGVVYVAYYGKLYIADISNAAEGEEISASVLYIPTNEDTSISSITDIIYQDGAVYIILNCTEYSYAGYAFSCGAVIKYDTFTAHFTVLGLVTERTTLKAKFYAQLHSGEDYKVIYEDAECTHPKFVTCNFLVPPVSETLSNEYFYGPQRFVGIKPKKLVISDDGIAFYADSDGSNYYKNVNRVVVIDLEKFAIESSCEVDTTFTETVTLIPRTSFNNNDMSNYYASVYGISLSEAGNLTLYAEGGVNASFRPNAGKIEFERRD